ncbi:MAG: glycosyltransferase family 2 protein [Candidatus Hydrothermia bacterium]
MNYSAVIPTYRRKDDLIKCVENLLAQTIKPSEVIISGVSTDEETKEAFKILKGKYPEFNIKLVLSDRRGISVGRNKGLEAASCEFVLMVDDDVELPPDFAEKALEILVKEGVYILTGIEQRKMVVHRLQNLFRKIFFLDYYEPNKQLVLQSGAKVIPSVVNTDIKAQYLGSHVWMMRRFLIEKVKFDERMALYSHREDQDFSYTVFKIYGPVLLITPRLTFIHHHSAGGRVNFAQFQHIYVYNLTLNYVKHFLRVKGTKIIFAWSMMGLILQSLHHSLKNSQISIFVETFNAVFRVINNWRSIALNKFDKIYGIFHKK